jgi:hypothetical protein
MKKIELEEENKKLKRNNQLLYNQNKRILEKYYEEHKPFEEKTETIMEWVWGIICGLIVGYLGITLFAWIIKITIKFWIGLF